ncbi:MAG TPA: carbohydrate kinase [Caulobacteraceae bacterium]
MAPNNHFALSSRNKFQNGEIVLSGAVLVLDVGKTHTKLTLVSLEGHVPVARVHANRQSPREGALDAEGIEVWVMETIRQLAAETEIVAVAPVAHGAAAALVAGDRLVAPVLDYEASPPPAVVARYDSERDPFGRTLSPRLQAGLNLGVQLAWHEDLNSDLWTYGTRVLTWPQYWSFRLCGELASEVTSLGCHTDLWFPAERDFSTLAKRRGWAKHFAPTRQAGEILGTVTGDVARDAHLPTRCEVICGLHDSNASLLAARAQPDLAGGPFCLVSTGTWFVAMQSGATRAPCLDDTRDTLGNVDIAGRVVPSARFMGGREYVAIAGDAPARAGSLADAASLIERGVTTRGTFTSGCGPFPHSAGGIDGEPRTAGERAALASLHLALVTTASLELIAVEGPLVVEGRFAQDPVFPAALAALRPEAPVICLTDADGIAFGAARLCAPNLLSTQPAARVASLAADIEPYAKRWLNIANRA